MKINLKSLLFHTLVPLMISFIIAMLLPDYSGYYDSLNVPLRFPPIVFSIVWSVLYILMGLSAYFIENSENDYNKSEVKRAMFIYYLQLVLNLSYTIVAFYFKSIIGATLVLLVLLVLVIMLFFMFYKIKKISGYLLIPYIIWLLIASYIQVGIYFLN